jgi:hypothetical protein
MAQNLGLAFSIRSTSKIWHSRRVDDTEQALSLETFTSLAIVPGPFTGGSSGPLSVRRAALLFTAFPAVLLLTYSLLLLEAKNTPYRFLGGTLIVLVLLVLGTFSLEKGKIEKRTVWLLIVVQASFVWYILRYYRMIDTGSTFLLLLCFSVYFVSLIYDVQGKGCTVRSLGNYCRCPSKSA